VECGPPSNGDDAGLTAAGNNAHGEAFSATGLPCTERLCMVTIERS
jgi:hypothetical protein